MNTFCLGERGTVIILIEVKQDPIQRNVSPLLLMVSAVA